MFQLKKITQNEEFFKNKTERGGDITFGMRLTGYSPTVKGFLTEYYNSAQKSGLVQLGKLPNPTTDNLSYYSQMVGDDFQLDAGFFSQKLTKWLPRLSPLQNQTISKAIYETLLELQSSGKNLNILKNIFIKFMCWMYYRLERLLRQLGGVEIPKILYQGELSDYELRMFHVCSKAGCDLLLLLPQSGANYPQMDKENRCTHLYDLCPLEPFPPDFSIKKQLEEAKEKERLQVPIGLKIHSNRWSKNVGFSDYLTTFSQRGGTNQDFFTCFRMICGTEDKVNYEGNLYRFHQEMQTLQRGIVSVSALLPPSPQEINQIKRDNSKDTSQLCANIATNIQYPSNPALQKQLVYGFLTALMENQEFLAQNLSRQTTICVYLLCWLKQYQGKLFSSCTKGEVGCFVLLGGCFKLEEKLFLRFLSFLPTDILVLAPDLSKAPLPVEGMIVEQYSQSLPIKDFPTAQTQAQIGTTAYHAERELDDLLYQDTGMYRNQQFKKASPILLRTMYEEIALLWNQELKFRPNFSTIGDQVHMPVFFAKVSGVKENPNTYWNSIRNLVTPETLVVTNVPFFLPKQTELHSVATTFYRGGGLSKEAVFQHKAYQYSYLRKETQEHILDALDRMLSEKNIKGMGQNGLEYKVIGDVLSLDKELLRMIQWFDFTQKNPKVLYIHTSEATPSLEDAIMLSFLSAVGFDVVTFVPTGYQGVEVHYVNSLMEEHQIGGYAYDLPIPKLNPPQNPLKKLGGKIFKRGG